MASERKAIRSAIAALLQSPEISGIAGVYSNRIETFEKGEHPSISVYTESEESRPRDTSNNRYVRTMSLIVEVIARANSGLDDMLDDFADAIESRILSNQELGGLAVGIQYAGTELVLEGESVETAIGAARISFQIQYIK